MSEAKAKSKFTPEARRNLMIVGSAVLVGVMATVFIVSSGGKNNGAPKAVVPAVDVQQQVGEKPTQPSPYYDNLRRESNASGAAKAELQGKSFVPDLSVVQNKHSDKESSTDDAQRGSLGSQDAPSSPQGTQVNVPVQQTAQGSTADYDNSSAHKAYAAMVSVWGAEQPEIVDLRAGQVALQGSTNAQADLTAAQPAAAVAQPQKTILADKGTLDYATLDSLVDTDSESGVIATMQSGKFVGARLIGTVSTDYKTVKMTFSMMNWKGRGYAINAVAIDENTYRTAVSGNVNHRYAQRIVLPAIAAGIAKAGELAATMATTVVASASSTTVSSTPPTSTSLEAAAAGEVAKQTAAALTEDKPKPLVKKAQGSGIGILFMEAVVE